MRSLPLLPLLLLLSLPAAAQDFARSLADLAQPPVASVPGWPVDALGRPVSNETLAAYDRVKDSLKKRSLSPFQSRFLLTLLNEPTMDPGSFKTREALARHFADQGVGLGKSGEESVGESDLWRLVRAARAAAQAYRIPPAVLLCLTFRESGFDRGASAWTTSAKGVAQMTNPAVEDAIRKIKRDPRLREATETYARLLGAKMPDKVVGTPDVDALTKQLDRLRQEKAPAADIKAKQEERRHAILAHKDEPGHIYNIETNFGLGAVYLADLRYNRLAEVKEERKAWLTAVGAYNQGLGIANDLIFRVYEGPDKYNRASLDDIFNAETLSRLKISKPFQEEMLGEVGSVRRCAVP